MKDLLQAITQHIKGVIGEEEKRRAAVCAKCPTKEVRLYAEILNSEMKEINGFVCLECGCPLATKIFAKEQDNICPKWK